MRTIHPPKKVGIAPASIRMACPRLFSTFEQAYPVIFEAIENTDVASVDGIFAFGKDPAWATTFSNAGIPCLLMMSEGGDRGSSKEIRFTNDDSLDATLRNQTLQESAAPPFKPLVCQEHDRPIAFVGDQPIWLHRPEGQIGFDWVGWGLEELTKPYSLRDEARGWRFLRHLPLHNFLRRLTSDSGWQRPPLRATFLIDDPNLHCQSYGYLNFKQLALAAHEHNFHTVIATIPLDQWYVNRRVATLFRDTSESLSLMPHGNNHLHHELARGNHLAEALSDLAQALDRISRLELKSGLRVSRVMSPPHGVCSRVMINAMSRLGFDAVTCAQPIPWLDSAPADRPLTGWHCAEMLTGHFPVLHRRSIPHCISDRAHRDELVMMAFHRQPIILCGHHPDLADPETLPALAIFLNNIAPTHWCNLTEIINSNYETRHDGSILRVRVFSRRIKIKIPEGVDTVIFESPMSPDNTACFSLSVSGIADKIMFGETVNLIPLPDLTKHSLLMSVYYPDSLNAEAIPIPHWTPWPYLRRMLTELRDRVAPLVH